MGEAAALQRQRGGSEIEVELVDTRVCVCVCVCVCVGVVLGGCSVDGLNSICEFTSVCLLPGRPVCDVRYAVLVFLFFETLHSADIYKKKIMSVLLFNALAQIRCVVSPRSSSRVVVLCSNCLTTITVASSGHEARVRL